MGQARERSEAEGLEQAIGALEERRAELGDTVVESALGPMRQRLAELTTSQRSRRRQVTVLFADVKGYTSVVEKLDPEWVGALVDRLWGELGRIIVDHDGRVLQHLGDGVMALWGGEHSHEDEAERAVRAGLLMLERVIAEQPHALVLVATARPGLGDERAGWVTDGGLARGHRVVPVEQLRPNEVRDHAHPPLRRPDPRGARLARLRALGRQPAAPRGAHQDPHR
ncbi:MAG: adenylate/guanylate cyclase domain-containing protein [Actinomycetota bacterium]|nr:adenylate/guanylate cyclase domain-containing protein [Actinomycetota bacterium]